MRRTDIPARNYGVEDGFSMGRELNLLIKIYWRQYRVSRAEYAREMARARALALSDYSELSSASHMRNRDWTVLKVLLDVRKAGRLGL